MPVPMIPPKPIDDGRMAELDAIIRAGDNGCSCHAPAVAVVPKHRPICPPISRRTDLPAVPLRTHDVLKAPESPIDERDRRLIRRNLKGLAVNPELGGKIEAVIIAAANTLNLPVSAVLGPSQCKRVVQARRSVAVELDGMGLTLSEIGEVLGRHYTSILHLLGRARERSAPRRVGWSELPEADLSGEWAI